MAQSFIGIGITLLIYLIIEWYLWQAFKTALKHTNTKIKYITYTLYALLSVGALVYLINLQKLEPTIPPSWQAILQGGAMGVLFSKLLILLFLIIDDVRRFFLLINKKIAARKKIYPAIDETTEEILDKEPSLNLSLKDEKKITRSGFLSRIGLLSGGLMVGNFVWGTNNRYRYKVRKTTLNFATLPAAFKGFKIAQISDIHAGSFDDLKAVNDGIKMLLNEQPDIILFTGDLVNTISSEIIPYKAIFGELKAPYGVYSILGNHDYGDYHPFKTADEKKRNLEALYQHHADMGWDLLRNEHRLIEKDGAQIALIGVENWGSNLRFPKVGDIHKAQENLPPNIPFKILMSHDPSHWDAIVRPQFKDIQLTLSGHTHGMQFGIDLPWFKWSPSQYVYKQWAGLYSKEEQFLYVNRGYGFLGYKGRVGILPEITIIELT